MDRWRREVKIVCALLLLAFLLSYFFAHLIHMLFLITLILLIRQTMAVNELENWLSRGVFCDYRTRKGIWADIYYHLWKIKKADKKRKKKLSRMIEQFRTSTDALPDAAVVLGEYAEIEWINKAAREVLGLKKTDKGQRIPNLLRSPQFVQFLNSYDYQQKICIASPANDNRIL